MILSMLLTCAFSGNLGFAQQSASKGGGPESKITGYIYDGNAREPLQYASIAIYRKNDSTLVSGAIADSTGKFLVDDAGFGRFYLTVDFIGYQKKAVDEVVLNPRNRNKSLGKIYLQPASQALEGVDVTAEKNRIQYDIDKKIINVSKDLNAAGGTAVDVLRNTPSVEVDIEGNVSLRGSENFKVYIDGKPTVLEGNDLLKQIPAGSINQIEIITNPSAKYDPDGTGGIINVKMKEDHRGSFNGIVNASVRSNESYSGDFKVNYETGKFKFFVGADARDYQHDGRGQINRETFSADTTFFYDSEKNRTRNHDGYSFEAGLDYNINERNTLSISGKRGHYGFGFDFDSDIQSYTDPATSTDYAFNENVFDRTGDYFRGDVNYQLQFDDNGHKLQAMAYYSTSDDDELETQKDFVANENYEVADGTNPEKIRANTDEAENSSRFKIDYTLPLRNNGEFEAGLQSRFKDEDSEYTFNYSDSASDDWADADSLSSDYVYRRNISSVYATYSGSIGIFGLKAGLRTEYTDREISKSNLEESYVVNRWDWFPSFHMTLKMDKKNKIQASYSKRIRRPRGWFLDPVISYRDKYNVRQGNPELEPEYTNSYEVSYMRRFDGGFASIEAYYRKTNNEITRLTSVYTKEIMLMTFDNLDDEQNLGAELMVNTDVTEWWNINVSGSYYRYQVNDEINGENVSRESNNWSLRFNSDFNLYTDARLQVRGYYRGPSVTIQGERSSFFYTSLAFRQDFLNKNLNLTLSMRDLFGTMSHEFVTDQPDYYMKRKFDRESRILRLSVSYKINDYKKKRDRREEGPEVEMEGAAGGM